MKLLANTPFAGLAVLDFLRVRAIPGVEVVGADTYEHARTKLHVRVRTDGLELLDGDAHLARRVFDLDADGAAIDDHLAGARARARDAKMRALIKRTPGVRVPGTADGFELAVRTVLGQQVSVAAATTLCARLAAAFGTPDARVLAAAPVDAVAKIGVPKSRAATLIEIATALRDGRVALTPGVDVERTIAQLVELKGIGPWTAKYIVMRALGARDVFLEEDLVVRKALGKQGEALPPREAVKRAQPWSPYRSYAVLRLWKGVADRADSR